MTTCILYKQTVPPSLVGTIKLASMNNATEVSTIVVAKVYALCELWY